MRKELQTLTGGIESTVGPRLPDLSEIPLPFFGRGQDLDNLRRALGVVRAGAESRSVTIIAGGGIGKTRIIEEFARELRLLGDPPVRVYRSAAPPDGGPWSCFTQLLAQRFELANAAGLDDAKAAVRAEVAGLLDDRRVGDVLYLLSDLLELEFPQSPVTKALDDGGAGSSMLKRTILKNLIEADAAFGPICFVLDDLHHCHEQSLAMLRYLIDNVKAPVMFLCAGRPEILARGELAPEGERHAVLHLPPLGDVDTRALLGTLMVPGGVTPMHLVEQACELAGGNPARIEDTARFYRDRGTLPPPPSSPSESLDRRIDDLTATERLLLQKGALMGGVFWLSALVLLDRAEREAPVLWDEAADASRRELALRLSLLADRDYVLKLPDSTFPGDQEYVFRHRVERERIAQLTSPVDARRWHRLMADWLDGKPEIRSHEEYLEMLAEQYEKAGASESAARAYLDAAGLARAHKAPKKELAHYEKALALLGEGEYSRRLEALVRAGELLHRFDKLEAALECFRAALPLAFRLDRRPAWLAARLAATRVLAQLGRVDESMQHLVASVEAASRPDVAAALAAASAAAAVSAAGGVTGEPGDVAAAALQGAAAAAEGAAAAIDAVPAGAAGAEAVQAAAVAVQAAAEAVHAAAAAVQAATAPVASAPAPTSGDALDDTDAGWTADPPPVALEGLEPVADSAAATPVEASTETAASSGAALASSEGAGEAARASVPAVPLTPQPVDTTRPPVPRFPVVVHARPSRPDGALRDTVPSSPPPAPGATPPAPPVAVEAPTAPQETAAAASATPSSEVPPAEPESAAAPPSQDAAPADAVPVPSGLNGKIAPAQGPVPIPRFPVIVHPRPATTSRPSIPSSPPPAEIAGEVPAGAAASAAESATSADPAGDATSAAESAASADPAGDATSAAESAASAGDAMSADPAGDAMSAAESAASADPAAISAGTEVPTGIEAPTALPASTDVSAAAAAPAPADIVEAPTPAEASTPAEAPAAIAANESASGSPEPSAKAAAPREEPKPLADSNGVNGIASNGALAAATPVSRAAGASASSAPRARPSTPIARPSSPIRSIPRPSPSTVPLRDLSRGPLAPPRPGSSPSATVEPAKSAVGIDAETAAAVAASATEAGSSPASASEAVTTDAASASAPSAAGPAATATAISSDAVAAVDAATTAHPTTSDTVAAADAATTSGAATAADSEAATATNGVSLPATYDDGTSVSAEKPAIERPGSTRITAPDLSAVIAEFASAFDTAVEAPAEPAETSVAPPEPDAAAPALEATSAGEQDTAGALASSSDEQPPSTPEPSSPPSSRITSDSEIDGDAPPSNGGLSALSSVGAAPAEALIAVADASPSAPPSEPS